MIYRNGVSLRHSACFYENIAAAINSQPSTAKKALDKSFRLCYNITHVITPAGLLPIGLR